MRPTSTKVAASAAAVFTFALFVMTAPAANADTYCMATPFGVEDCSYTTMAQCQADGSGIGGMCSLVAPVKPRSDALAYLPRQRHSRHELRSRNEPDRH
jgi:hypothetical protein